MTEDRAANAIARVRAARRPVTAVEVRCGRRGHLMASLHPLGAREFLAWRRAGRLTGPRRDTEQWLRHGAVGPGVADSGFAATEDSGHILSGPQAHSARELFGVDGAALACSCTVAVVDVSLADAIGAALCAWWNDAQAGARPRPRVVLVEQRP